MSDQVNITTPGSTSSSASGTWGETESSVSHYDGYTAYHVNGFYIAASGNAPGGPYLNYNQFHETFTDSDPPVLPHADSGTGAGTGSPISSTNPIPPGGWVPLGYDPFCTSEDSSNRNQCVVCNQCAAISEDAAAAQSAGTGLFSFVIDFTRAFASAVPPAPEGDWELAPDAVDAIMAEAGSGDPFSGKTDAFLRSARGSRHRGAPSTRSWRTTAGAARRFGEALVVFSAARSFQGWAASSKPAGGSCK